MESAIYSNGIKLDKQNFNREDELEGEIKKNSKKLFGEKTIYLDIKRKIDAKSLGGSIPDGILLDLTDQTDIQFYLVEVELAKHSFYEHIFPQITKFLAFFKNIESQNRLITQISDFININLGIKREFEVLSGSTEIYRTIKEAMENNGKILLIIDKEKQEIEEAQRIYTDTWSKLVIPEILSKYEKNSNEVFILHPDFSEKELIIESEEAEKEPEKQITYTENYHLEGVDPQISKIYADIMNHVISIDPGIKTNPQKYYISLRKNRNFAYLDIKKRKIKIAIMLSYEEGQRIIQYHQLRRFTEGVQGFYGRASFQVAIENDQHLDEIFRLLEKAYLNQEER